MAERDRDFLRFYEQERVEDQLKYYRRQAGWHGRRDDTLLLISGILMFVAAVASGVSASNWEGVGPAVLWSSVAALVPALAAAVAATRALYEHERNHQRFENTFHDLEYLRAYKAPSAKLAEAEYRTALEEYVGEVEGLLSREHRQWVEVMTQVQAAQAPEPPGG